MKTYYVTLIFLFLSAFDAHSMDQLQKSKNKIQHLVNKQPKLWSENVPGVKRKLKTDQKIVALTLDACGRPGDSLDDRIVDYLIEHKIPATFFISYQWIQKHPEHFKRLKQYSFFDFQNHGLNHIPCSVNGKEIYGMVGTKNVDELLQEVELAALKLEPFFEKKPMLYRSGTAYYDEVAVEILNTLGYEVAGFDILGDAGASYSPEKVVEAFSKVSPGSIIIVHVNRPERRSGAGVPKAIETVLNKGYSFVKLADYQLE
jgi:peptidoglycan/xylan/chitin deacetylase (PgdA/CDA1 family)